MISGTCRTVLVCATFITAFSSLLGAQTTADKTSGLQNLPIVFEPNRGQVQAATLYVARSQRLSVALAQGGMDFSFMGSKSHRRTVGFKFEGASKTASVQASGATGGESNYLIGNDVASWHTHIPHFERVTYSRLYPGVDLVFYGNGPHLEHDFTIAPGSDPRKSGCVSCRKMQWRPAHGEANEAPANERARIRLGPT
jgi:hypothetical protein